MADDRSKAIELALSGLEKQFGKGSIMRLGSKDVVPISVISTGSISFDAALGVGGVPRGRVIEIFGPESSGKTTITLQIIAEAQKAGGLAAFVDAEHALDPAYAGKLGVDIDNLLVSQPDLRACHAAQLRLMFGSSRPPARRLASAVDLIHPRCGVCDEHGTDRTKRRGYGHRLYHQPGRLVRR